MLTRPMIAGLCVGLWITPAQALVYNVSTASQLQAALVNVRAGDEIVIAAGSTIQYENGAIDTAYFYSGVDGTASQPITIRSSSSSNLATIRGNDVASKILLRVTGDYWVIKDLKFTNGQKGIVLDNSNHSKISNVVVNGIGLEAIHVRDGSDYTTIENCSIFDTGISNPQFGEGIYIGSDRSVWSTYNSSVDYTLVRNCTIGPDVRAEPFDIKEGTTETIVERNTIYGTGISLAAFEDSFIDLKGVRSYVRFNTFYQGNEPNIKRAIAVLDRDRPLSGYEHVIHDNVFNMDDATTPLLEAYSGTSEVYAYNNTRNPAGEMYTSRVIQERPSWYGGGGPPTNQLPNVSITSITSASPSGFVAGSSISISASASDVDGSIADVAFYAGATFLGRDTTAPYGINWLTPSAGSYSMTASATDNLGATRTSAAQSIVVNPVGGGGGGSNQLVVLYQRGDSVANDNRIRAHVQIKNNGSGVANLSELKLRYWFSKEGNGTPAAAIDYSVIPSNQITTRFVNVSGANYYLELSFAAGAGSLAAGASTGAIKLRITTSTNVNQDETNDYSFGPAVTSYQEYNKVTLHRGTNLIWGVAP